MWCGHPCLHLSAARCRRSILFSKDIHLELIKSTSPTLNHTPGKKEADRHVAEREIIINLRHPDLGGKEMSYSDGREAHHKITEGGVSPPKSEEAGKDARATLSIHPLFLSPTFFPETSGCQRL